jgi:hypothetical protein
MIDAGQRSRISRRKGIFFSLLIRTPAKPQKNCGEVAIIIFGFFTKSPAMTAVIIYDKKLILLFMVPLFAAI